MSAARASMGARSVRDEEPVGGTEEVAVRPSCRTDRCWDDACRSSPAGPVAAWTAGDGERRGRPPTGAVWATREASAARRSARARRASDMGVMVRGERGGGRRIPAHPYLARQMSDFGFRQTLEVRTLGCARRFSPPTYLHPSALLGSKLWKEQHKRHRVYTGSGHRCGVIPYSSVWCGGLPQGLMVNSTKGEQPREGLFLSWCNELLG